MRSILLLCLFASPAFAQSAAGVAVAPGCGASDVSFSVETDKNQHPFAKPDVGKALVYFVEDDSDFNAVGKPTVRAGLDGAWVGATHGSSYFYFPVDPGEHQRAGKEKARKPTPQRLTLVRKQGRPISSWCEIPGCGPKALV